MKYTPRQRAALAETRRGVDREGPEQAALVQWAASRRIPWAERMVGDYLIHVPNGGGKLPARVGAKLKRMGLTPGVSDLFLALPAGEFHGLWLEMKAPGKTWCSVTPEQRAWLDRMAIAGYYATWAAGWGEARLVVEQYLALGPFNAEALL